MIETKNKQILIDGRPQIIMCGEIHYYRLPREVWQDRIDKLLASGCNAVASYVPWLCHEPVEGQFDFEGTTREELDLCAFIDLCKDNGLYFFVRPGPFIMAEMKNEGLPYWVYEKHPEIIPVSWDDEPVPTKTVDYLAPGFLNDVKHWYEAVMAVIEPRLYTKGGNIIGVQLDNEVGMLSWVSNRPDLTDHLLGDFAEWLKNFYDEAALKNRYAFDIGNEQTRAEKFRSPEDDFAAELLHDLGYYMRDRFARYIATLRSYAEEFGVKDVPFVVNIHGTGQGRGFTFPIGISQLYESYTQAPGYISGSDIYFGDLDMDTFQDLYIINGFMDAVHNPDQPLTSVEFNCGDGNFGCTYGGRHDPSAVDFKMRMCVAQGNRLINHYLFTGGFNYRFDEKVHDGNDRIAFTGERHGFAAPVNPEGELNYTYPRMARVIQTIMAVSDKLAVMNEEHDDVAFAFIPDYYMTEYYYPDSHLMREIIDNLSANRASGAWEIMGRAMLLSGYRFGSTDVQNKPLDPDETPVVTLPSAKYMSAHVQTKLKRFLEQGGSILIYGEIPMYDMEGNRCEILAETLGVRPTGVRRASENYHLSVIADGWAKPRPEVRTSFAQVFEPEKEVEALFRVYDTEELCGFDVKVGKGRAIVIGAAYTCDIPLFRNALEKLGTRAALSHDYPHHGIFMTTTAANSGERFLHLLNLDGLDKRFHLHENGRPLFDGREILLQSKDGVMLPLNVSIGDVTIDYSTAEIVKTEKDAIHFRLTQAEDVLVLRTEREIEASEDYWIEKGKREGETLIRSRKHAKVDDHLLIRFR